MSVFNELCLMVNEKASLNSCISCIEEHNIDITENDNLLLLLAAQEHQIELIEYLLEKGANLYSRQCEWFFSCFRHLSKEKVLKYLPLIINNQEKLKFNLYLQIWFCTDYSDNEFLFTLFEHCAALTYKEFIKMPIECKVLLQNHRNYLLIMKTTFDDFKNTVDNNQQTYVNFEAFVSHHDIYKSYPYCLDAGLLEKLKNKSFDLINRYDLSFMPLDILSQFFSQYPEYFDYILQKNGIFFLDKLSIDALSIILQGQTMLEGYTKQSSFYISNFSCFEKLTYIFEHLDVNLDTIKNFFLKSSEAFDFFLINHLFSKNNYAGLIALAFIAINEKNEKMLTLIQEKINLTLDEIAFIQACQYDTLDKIKEFIKRGININCGEYQALLASSLNSNDETIYPYILSHCSFQPNPYLFELGIALDSKEIVDYCLKTEIPIPNYYLCIINILVKNLNFNFELCHNEKRLEEMKEIFLIYFEEQNFIHMNEKAFSFLLTHFKSFDFQKNHTFLFCVFLCLIEKQVDVDTVFTYYQDYFEQAKHFNIDATHIYLNHGLILRYQNSAGFLKKLLEAHMIDFTILGKCHTHVHNLFFSKDNAQYFLEQLKGTEAFDGILKMSLIFNYPDLFHLHSTNTDYFYFFNNVYYHKQWETLYYLINNIFIYQRNKALEVKDILLHQCDEVSKKALSYLETLFEKERIEQFNVFQGLSLIIHDNEKKSKKI
jgi:hypothetical protein